VWKKSVTLTLRLTPGKVGEIKCGYTLYNQSFG
jgi:hypothetical protein